MQIEVAKYKCAIAFGRLVALRQTKGDGSGIAMRKTLKPKIKVILKVSNTSAQK
jgi:hypothetical protein